ncbi:MAG: rod shape-determining protein [Culicoidibacterales bacterium]
MFGSKDVGIDLGTANILIYVQGKGIVLNEPTVVAVDSKSRRLLAVGEEAREMIGRTPGQVEAIRPLKDGVIADFEATEAMLQYFMSSLNVRGLFSRPRILICCPTNITTVERNAIREAAERAGAKQVFLEEEPKVAAIGAGLDVSRPTGNMIFDIGGGTTDIAVISLGEIVTSASVKIAGNKFDGDILRHIKDKHKLLIGERTAEQIKIQIATVYAGGRDETMQVRGRDLVTGLPKTITITSEEIELALRESVSVLVSASKTVLEQTPPELAADIIDRGIVLTGGGALLHGLDQLLSDELLVPVFIAEEPLSCVARGTGAMLENIDKYGLK